ARSSPPTASARADTSRFHDLSSSKNRRSASGFALPVVDAAGGGVGGMAPFAVVGDDLARIGVLADLGVGHGAHREIGEVAVGVVDDLVRGLGAAHRAADDVAGAD